MPEAPPRRMFISRQTELSVLCRALEDAQRRHGQIVLVSGEPGIGKTRLAQEFAAIAAAGTVSVLWGRCVQGEATLEVEANLAAAERLRDHGLLADALYVASVLAMGTNRRLLR